MLERSRPLNVEDRIELNQKQMRTQKEVCMKDEALNCVDESKMFRINGI